MVNNKIFRNVKDSYPDNIRDITGHTLMVDLKTDLISDQGYKNFLCVINITTNQVDAQPLKNKTAEEVTNAFYEIYRRRIIKNIQGTKRIICDKGSEFASKTFIGFCNSKSIEVIFYNMYHLNSTANVERAIGTITRILLEELAKRSIKEKRKVNAWTHLLPLIVFEINRHAKQKYTLEDVTSPPTVPKNLYPIGTEVHRAFKQPVHLLTSKEKMKFRNGDKRFTVTTFKITDYRIRDSRPIRYILDDDYSISYNHNEIIPA